MEYQSNIYSNFANRKHLEGELSIEALEELIESDARREESYDRILAEQNLIEPDTKKPLH